MHTVTTEETVALESAAPAQNMLLVPLSQLRARPSKRNVRRTRRTSIAELAASYAKDAVMRSAEG
jgi:ParB family chromosome partitioning protein